MGKYLVIIVVLLAVFCNAAPSSSQDTMAEDALAQQTGALSGLDSAQTEAAIAVVKQQLHGVQLALERWSVDDPGYFYPESINQLVVPWEKSRSYLPTGFYDNPFTAAGEDETDAMCVPFGWSELAPGNFSYLAQYDRKGHATGYLLVGYGLERESKWDLDGDGEPEGIILILSAGKLDWQTSSQFYDAGRKLTIDIVELP